jgi:short-subunit dehydrogenase
MHEAVPPMTLSAFPDLDVETARQLYGPWAVIAGASDGTGAAYARCLASLGVNVMLVARRGVALEQLAGDIRAAHGVQTRVLVQDLMALDAGAAILQAAAELDVGLYVSNAGADGGGSAYVDSPVERWLNVVNMNVRTVTHATHGFGQRFSARGRGGILLMCSIAALGGQPWLAMYSATKAFEMVLAEALWAELGGSGVDVLALLAPAMDTPTFRRGVAGTDYDVSQAYSADSVAREGLAHLRHGPLLIYPFTMSEAEAAALTDTRASRLDAMAQIGRSLMKTK